MTLRQQLRVSLQDSEYRHAYADEQLNLSIGTQIKVLREQQEMTQEQLAAKIGTKQAGISRLESANYAGWSIAALRRVAQALDLRLRVSFEEFGTLWKEVASFGRQSLQRRPFSKDPEFCGTIEAKRKIRRKRSRPTPTPTHRHRTRRSQSPQLTRSQNLPGYQSRIVIGVGNTTSEVLPWTTHMGNNSSTALVGGIHGN
jgi:transcriptional regulator with XRE-family HTH domain